MAFVETKVIPPAGRRSGPDGGGQGIVAIFERMEEPVRPGQTIPKG